MFQPRANVLALGLIGASMCAMATQPATLRVDYTHSGNALQEIYSLDRVVLEPLPWPGNPDRRIDTLDRGAYQFEVVDPVSGEVLYSRGFSSIFGEWRTTPEARQQNRSFGESLRFPKPDKPVRIRLYARDDRNRFSMVWTQDIDPADVDVRRAHPPLASPLIAIRQNGASKDKVDLLILGDGYTEAERAKFVADARRLSDALFAVSPFKDRASDFNVWALMAASPESGVARPSSGLHRWTPLGTRYDAFGSERYVLTFDNRAFRDLAQYAPYEFVEILVNNETYGGGGIYGLYSTAAADSEWAPYLFVHEFGHHFAGLADEYYTSPVSYETGTSERREPWEPNVTALRDPANLKWRNRVTQGTPLPTSWPKAAFEKHQREVQKVRAELRKDDKPESEMNALFHREQRTDEELFMSSDNSERVGAFEGANYEATGFYRAQMNCTMFTRTSVLPGLQGCHRGRDRPVLAGIEIPESGRREDRLRPLPRNSGPRTGPAHRAETLLHRALGLAEFPLGEGEQEEVERAEGHDPVRLIDPDPAGTDWQAQRGALDSRKSQRRQRQQGRRECATEESEYRHAPDGELVHVRFLRRRARRE